MKLKHQIDNFLINKILLNEKYNFKENKSHHLFFIIGMFIILPVGTLFDDIFRPNLKLEINQPIIAKTNVGKNRVFPAVLIDYQGKKLYIPCRDIEIKEICQDYPKYLEIKQIAIRPNYLNYMRNDGFAFIYNMTYVNHQGQLVDYYAKDLSQKLPISIVIFSYLFVFYVILIIYLVILNRKVNYPLHNETLN